MKKLLLLFFAFVCFDCVQAQPYHAPLNSQSDYLYERLSVLHGNPNHFSIRPFGRRDIATFALRNDFQGLSKKDKADLQYLLNDNSDFSPESASNKNPNSNSSGFSTTEVEATQDTAQLSGYEVRDKPFVKHLFKTPAHLFELNTKGFQLKINPLIRVDFGKEKGDSNLVFMNQRGIELRGNIDEKVWFYTNVLESQARFPSYVRNYVSLYRAVPGAGFYKQFKSRVADIEDAYDYNVAEAFVGFNATKHIGIQLGHGKQFIGNGIRSMFLSDFSNLNYYFKINTRVWKLHYQNLFMELAPYSSRNNPNTGDNLLPKKYIAAHYLSYKPKENLQFGFFETTVFNRSEQFELQYLNPVILYRTVEGMLGSPDNALIGVDARWDIKKRVSIYGQFLLDEFNFSELIKPEIPGWWANKYGIQLGAKYFNAFAVDHLDLQVEYNSARPYTYSHRETGNSFTHYSMPLAHPLGANFREFLAIARYQFNQKLQVQANFMHYTKGEDADGSDWGGNPLLSYEQREMEYNNEIGQGYKTDVTSLGLDVNYQFHHNTFLDFRVLNRVSSSTVGLLDRNDFLINVGVRMNLWNQNFFKF